MLGSVRKTFNEMDVGTRWAYVGNVQGIGASIALNASEAASRGQGAGPVIVAGSVPVFLYVALEILARKVITGWKRWITYPGFMVVVAVTFVTSYQDQVARLKTWEFDKISAHILPIGIDGLMVVAAVALLEGIVKHKPLPEVETFTLAEIEETIERILSEKPVEMVTHIVSEEPWEDPYRPPIEEPQESAAESGERPERPVWRPGARGQGRPRRADPLRDEWERRQFTEKPMTSEELAGRDGKGINSARSKIQRWKRDYDREVRAGALGGEGRSGEGADSAGPGGGTVDPEGDVVEPAPVVEADAEPSVPADLRAEEVNV